MFENEEAITHPSDLMPGVAFACDALRAMAELSGQDNLAEAADAIGAGVEDYRLAYLLQEWSAA